MKAYLSMNGLWHRIVWNEKKMWLACISAVGHKTRSQVKFMTQVDLPYGITCKNCLKKYHRNGARK